MGFGKSQMGKVAGIPHRLPGLVFYAVGGPPERGYSSENEKFENPVEDDKTNDRYQVQIPTV